MTRRKVILPYWTPSKEEASNKESLNTRFEDLSQGELIINNSTEGAYLTILDSNNNLATFDSSKVSDTKISESFESATTFVVSAITETKTELTDAISSATTYTDSLIEAVYESATTFAVSAITETKSEFTDAIASASAYTDTSILNFYEKTVLNLKYNSSENKVYYKGHNTLEWSELESGILGITLSLELNSGISLTSVNMVIVNENDSEPHSINDFKIYADKETGSHVLTWNFNGKKYTWYNSENISIEEIGNNGDINITPYNEGSGITIENNTIHVNIDEDGFLKVNEENELTVTGVTLDAAVTSKDITIEGGQWATAVKTVFTGGTVPAGTTWQSFLESMLCVEKFDTSYSMSKTFTVSCGTLGEGITGTTNNSSVEVGTKVSLKSFEANPTTASQSYTVSTFDYGYKLGEDGTYNKNTSFTEKLTPSLKASNDALTATFTTFVDESGNTIAKISGNTSMGEVKMRVMDGTNKVVIAQTGDTYTASSAVTAGTIYVATNLKNYYKSDKKTPNTYTPSYASEDKTATASTTYTVTGYRNTFYGTTSKTDAADATFIRTLTKSNKAIASGNTISFDTNSSDGHLRMVIASPRTIKSVKNQTGTQDLTALLVGTKATVSVGGIDNFAPISYNVYDYTWKGAFGNETWIITFA